MNILNAGNPMPFQIYSSLKHECKYIFHDFQNASNFAKIVACQLGEDVHLSSLEEGYIVQFSATWADEEKLIEKNQSDEYYFRSGSQCSIEEAKLIFEMFASWVMPEEIEKSTRRTKGEVSALLENMGCITSFPGNIFIVETQIDDDCGESYPFYSHWRDGYDTARGLSEKLVLELLRLNVIQDASRFAIGEIEETTDEDNPESNVYFEFRLFNNQDCSNIYSYLGGLGMWDEISDFSESRGDSLIHLRTFRRTWGRPLDFLTLLERNEGLPCDLSYQKQLLSAYKAWYYSCHYLDRFLSWIEAAKKRTSDIYAKRFSEFPGRCPFSVGSVEKNQIAAALDAADNAEAIESLATLGNRFAAAILADEYRIKSRQNSRFNSDVAKWDAMQGGYWPQEHEIHDAFLEHKFYDKKHAEKMKHIAEFDGRISFRW